VFFSLNYLIGNERTTLRQSTYVCLLLIISLSRIVHLRLIKHAVFLNLSILWDNEVRVIKVRLISNDVVYCPELDGTVCILPSFAFVKQNHRA